MTRPANPQDGPRILIVGGGSGGHISPGLAVAETLAKLGGTCHFVCSERAIDAAMLSGEGRSFETVPARPFRIGPVGLAHHLQGIRRSSVQVRELLERSKFESILALGGFVAASVLPGIRSYRSRSRAGDRNRQPLVLLNLDRVPGKANRRVARRADIVLSAVDTIKPGFASSITGLPIRSAALAPGDAADCRRELGLQPDTPVLLITGASQGAASLNRLMRRLLETRQDGLGNFQVLHLSGTNKDTGLEKAYEQAGVRALVLPFLERIGLAWGAATIAISRAGANSVGEIQANTVPAIFLPYPYHRDRHQFHNAQPLVEAGGAHVVEDKDDHDTAEATWSLAIRVLEQPLEHQAMMDALASQARPEAAETVASTLLEVGGG